MSAVQQSDTATIDVAEFIDSQPVGRFQIRLLATCAAVLFLDGFDTQAIGFVAPALAREWGVTKVALGPVFSAGLFGLMLGALLFGPLADRVGRKKIIIVSTVAFGLGALITAFVQDVSTLIVIRFLTGLGLGGAMPNAIALTSEFNPRRRRATMVMIMFCGFSVGAALGGLLAAALIPQFGWRSVFVVGGVAPLLLAPILAVKLPESVRFLALTRGFDARVAQLLLLVNPGAVFAPATRFVVDEPKLSGIPVKHLFTSGRTVPTLLLWVVFFMSLLDLYFLSNWLPTVLNDLGASLSQAALSVRCCKSAAWSEPSRLAASSIASRFVRWRWCISPPCSRSAQSASSDIRPSSSRWRFSRPAFASSADRSPPMRWPRDTIRPR
jgi:AAHS family 4-hydroxybenzoate transporter-like MFS transporter